MSSQVILLAVEGPMKGRSVVLADQERVVFGRSRDCGKGLMPAEDKLISRKHFMVEADGPRLRVWDLDSKHGTQVIKPGAAGQPGRIVQVTANRACENSDLRQGDRIRAGQTLFEIQVVVPPAAGPARPETCPECGRALDEEARGGQALPLALFCKACLDLEEASAQAAPEARATVPAGEMPLEPAAGRGHMRISPGEGPPQVRGFRVEEKLGDGRYGSSFLGRRSSDGAPLVLKVFRFDQGLDAPARAWLEERLRGLLSLSHENLVRLEDFGLSAPGLEGTAVCLAQEYCPGGNVLQRAAGRGGRLPPHLVYDLMRDTLEALAFLHGRGLVHGRITPQNLLLAGGEGAVPVKVGDGMLASLWHHLGMHPTGSQSGEQSSSGFAWQRPPAHPGLATMASDLRSASALFRQLLRGPSPARARRSTSAPRPGKPAAAGAASAGNLPPEGLGPLFDLVDRGLGLEAPPGFATAGEMRDALADIPRPLVVAVAPGRPDFPGRR